MFKQFNIVYVLSMSFISGVLIGSFFSWNFLSPVIIIIDVVFLLIGRVFNLKIVKKYAIYFVCSGVILSIGILYVQGAQKHVSEINKFNLPANIVVDGYIDKEPEQKLKNQNLVLNAKKINIDGKNHDIYERVLIITDPYPNYEYGQILQVKGKIDKPKNFDNSFDYVKYLEKQKIYSVIYYPKEIQQNEKQQFGLLKHVLVNAKIQIFKIKNAFQDSINRSIPEPSAAFINGILLGNQTGIDQDLKYDFSRTGMTHIMAISGYNVTIIAKIVVSILVLFMMRQKAFWFTVICIIIFTIMVGAESSIIRAAIMGIIVLIARQTGRIGSPHVALSLAASAMLAFNPTLLRFDIGFQLSFMATVGIIYISPIFGNKMNFLYDFPLLRETIAMTISAQLCVLPLLMYYFKTLSIISLFANAIILPVIPYAMFLGFCAGLTGIIFEPLGYFFGTVTWIISSLVLKIINILSEIPGATISISIKWYSVIIFYLLLFIFYKITSKKNENTN